jgi:hypothetical protein
MPSWLHLTIHTAISLHLPARPPTHSHPTAPHHPQVRTGLSEDNINLAEVVEALASTGAAALTVHGRTQEQRYSRASDWELVGRAAASGQMAVIGNGV